MPTRQVEETTHIWNVGDTTEVMTVCDTYFRATVASIGPNPRLFVQEIDNFHGTPISDTLDFTGLVDACRHHNCPVPEQCADNVAWCFNTRFGY